MSLTNNTGSRVSTKRGTPDWPVRSRKLGRQDAPQEEDSRLQREERGRGKKERQARKRKRRPQGSGTSLNRTCSQSAFNQSINPQRRQTPLKEEGQHDTHNQPPQIQPLHHQREQQAPKKRKRASTINNQREHQAPKERKSASTINNQVARIHQERKKDSRYTQRSARKGLT